MIKNLSRTRAWLISKKKKSSDVCLKKPVRTYNKKPTGVSIQTLVKVNPTKNFTLDIENQLIKHIGLSIPFDLLLLIVLLTLL
jgi:hypothetical protein